MVKIIGNNQGVQELKDVLIEKGYITDDELKQKKIKNKQKDNKK